MGRPLAVKPDRKGENSIKVTTQPVRLKRDIAGQNRGGATTAKESPNLATNKATPSE